MVPLPPLSFGISDSSKSSAASTIGGIEFGDTIFGSKINWPLLALAVGAGLIIAWLCRRGK